MFAFKKRWMCVVTVTEGSTGYVVGYMTRSIGKDIKIEENAATTKVPYISKEDSEYEVTGNIVGSVGPESTEKDSSFLIKTLRSFKEALIKDDDTNVAEIEAFLLCIDVDDEKNSLMRKIIALDELLITVRDCVLRAGAESVFYRLRAGADSEFCTQKTETESWWQMCKGKLWRSFFAS
ncbi:hypothetical protein VPH35_130524 [Triticum aestivum]